MASFIPLGLFARTIKPGQPFELESETDIIITNVCFGENVNGQGRSCLKLQFSDLAEDDEEDEDLADLSVDAPASKPETKASKKAGNKSAEMAEDDEDEEDDEDSDDEEESDDSMMNFIVRETVLASLIPGKIENAQINLMLCARDLYKLIVTGENDIHISGSYIRLPFDDSDSEDDSDEDDEMYDSDGILIPSDEDEALENEWGKYDPSLGLPGGEVTGLGSIGSDEEESDEEEEDDSDRFQELAPTPQKPKGKAAKAATNGDIDMADAVTAAPVEKAAPAAAPAADEAGLSKNQRKKLAKQQKKEAAQAKPEVTAVNGTKTEKVAVAKDAGGAETKETAKKTSKKVTLPSGLSYSEPKTGKGAQAKAGQKVEIRYVGKLESGKIFDSNTSGKPFSFSVGKGEVIKGMDEGILGMSIGGERKLHIPAKLGYGKAGTQGIPSNANLTFDIKLISIK